MQTIERTHLTAENRRLLAWRDARLVDAQIDPQLIWPRFLPCKVRVLLVTDGNLDFSAGDFGLSTFVGVLLNATGPARFEVALAHLRNRSGAAMMAGEDRIENRIANFKFDDPGHFSADSYDVVFLFGIDVFLSRSGTAANGQPYPNDRLADSELQVLAEFQNGGGGLFATGDHGALGRFMGQALPRARHMRLWDSTSGSDDLDEVSMGGPRRNDTNRFGDPGSQFNDQSDDVPQQIQPRIYSIGNSLFEYTFPHPVLCGPNGPIRVMPDHPHEGECVEASDTNQSLNFTAPAGQEFPPATSGGLRPLPEVISTNSVLAGTTSGTKDPTLPHSFGGICAYDGHRAGIGRVITDATWHHFVNVNLVGSLDVMAGVKSIGFLASTSGQTHFGEIKTYFRNLATWLSRPENIDCMSSRLILRTLYTDRVLEAVLTTSHVRLAELQPKTMVLIGRHARDVIGRFAGQCQSMRLVLDLVIPELDLSFIPDIDPWLQRIGVARRQAGQSPFAGMNGVTWLNLDAALDMALGAALVAVNEELGVDDERQPDDAAVRKVAQAGARSGFRTALGSVRDACQVSEKLVR